MLANKHKEGGLGTLGTLGSDAEASGGPISLHTAINAYFQFTAYDEFEVHVRYTKHSGVGSALQKILLRILPRYADGEKEDVLARSLIIHGSVENLKSLGDPARDEGGPWWDYWWDITFELPPQ